MKDGILIRDNRLPLTVSEHERDTTSAFIVAHTILHTAHYKALAHIAAKFTFRNSEPVGNNVSVYNRVVGFMVLSLDHSERGPPLTTSDKHKITFFLREQYDGFVLSTRWKVEAMHGSHGLIDKLYRRRESLQAALDWHESLHSSSDEDAGDGTEAELRDEIKDIQLEIATIERRLAHRH